MVELGPAEAVLMKPSTIGFERGELGRKSGDPRALLGSRSVCRRSSSPLLRRCSEAGELGAERRGMALWRLIGRERHAPDLLAGLSVEVVEEFGEADDEVDLA